MMKVSLIGLNSQTPIKVNFFLPLGLRTSVVELDFCSRRQIESTWIMEIAYDHEEEARWCGKMSGSRSPYRLPGKEKITPYS